MPASALDSSTQFDRDLRSANKEWKRAKDSSAKWSFGVRPAAGVRPKCCGPVASDAPDSLPPKVRPHGKACDRYPSPKPSHNVVKMRAKGHNAHLPAGRLRGKIHAAAEMRDPHAASRSLDDLLPLSASAATRVADALESHILYSFDRAETTPGRPLALDVFVTAGARDTERLVEKEYEVLDANGEALRGRKARRNLRQAAAAQHAVMEDEEFELV